MARPKGSTNKRTQGVLAVLKKEFDLDPILKLAEVCQREKPLIIDGEIQYDSEGKEITIPFLAPNELITALGKLADKTYPNLKAVDVTTEGERLPVAVLNLRGLEQKDEA
jgi:hypothetical protein